MSSLTVIGAGPAGLMAALAAAEAGHEVTVFEAAAAVGGMAGSYEVAGQRVDFGSHRLHPEAPPGVLDRISSLLGDDLQVRPRRGRIRLRDRWIGFPLQLTEMARRLPPAFTVRVSRDTATGPFRRTSDGSFEGEVTRRLGPTIAREFYGPYARKLYGVDAADLDGELARRRIAARSPIDIARGALRAARRGGGVFLYPKRGYGQISEALADAVVDAGGEIRLSSPVSRLDAGPGADVALSTMPVPALLGALDPAPPDPVTTALARLRTRGMVLVHLVVPRPQYTPWDAHYFPEPTQGLSRLSEPKNYRTNDADPHDLTVLCAELPCWVGDEVWTADPARLADAVADDLHRSGLPRVDHVAAEVRRLPSVYPVYERSTRADRAVVEDWLATLSGPVLTLGRQGLGVPDNLHHVVEMGAAAAEVVGGDGSVAVARWQGHLASFAANVVQD